MRNVATFVGLAFCTLIAKAQCDRWHPLPSGAGTDQNLYRQVYALSLASNGWVWVGGDFQKVYSGIDVHNFSYLAAMPGAASGMWHSRPPIVIGAVKTFHSMPNGEMAVGGRFYYAYGQGDQTTQTVGGILVLSANLVRSHDWRRLGEGTNGEVQALQSLPDGRLVAGGSFTQAGGLPANRVALWDGQAWQPMGDGLDKSNGTFGTVVSLAVLSDGSIVAAGDFDRSGLRPMPGLARWDGTEWHAFEHPTGTPHQMCVTNNGELFVCGSGGTASWDGNQWCAIESPRFRVHSLLAMPNGDVVAGGRELCFSCNPVSLAARWNGTVWIPMPGLQHPLQGRVPGGVVNSLVLLPNGEIIAGGKFSSADGLTAHSLARWAPGGVAPAIASSPSSQVICEGDLIRVTVSASGTALRYQWRFNGVHIAGENSPAMNRPAVSTAAEGRYDCVVSNDCGEVISDAATITVREAVQITTQPSSLSLPPGSVGVFSVVARGAGLGYQWRRNGAPLPIDPRFLGSNTATLTILSISSADQALYDCVVTGTCGPLVSDAAILDCRPIVSSEPEGGAFYSGAAITLSPEVATAGSTTYRWRKDGVNIVNGRLYRGVTTPALTIAAEDPNQSGSFVLSITNSCGTTATRSIDLVVTCLGDFNQDGGVDGGDVVNFFDLWASGEVAADANQDGGIDFGDVERFFDRWESGC